MTKNERFEEAAKIEGHVTAKSEETRKIVKSDIATKYSVEELMKAAKSRPNVSRRLFYMLAKRRQQNLKL